MSVLSAKPRDSAAHPRNPSADPRGGSPKKSWFPRSIAVTVLLFNVLLVFLPAASFFFLDTHEKLLLRSLEHALVQQARIFAAALSQGLAIGTGKASLDARDASPAELSATLKQRAEAIVEALRQRHDARLRIFDAQSMLLVDSAQFGNAEWAVLDYGRSGPPNLAQESLLYQIGSLPTRAARALFGAPDPPVTSADFFQGKGPFAEAPELRSALAGRYGAATRIIGSPEPAVVLYSAIPVYAPGAEIVSYGTPSDIAQDPSVQPAGNPGPTTKPVGVVLASQSTYRILRDLYVLRLEMFRVVVASVFVALLVSLVLSFILIQPLRVLSRQAAEALDHRGRFRSGFKPLKGHNEVAVLSQSLADLSTRLEAQLRFVEGFSQDLVHEIRNPIASLGASLEMLGSYGASLPPESRRFISHMENDLKRMNSLVGGIREISRIDIEDPGESMVPLDLTKALDNCAERFRILYPTHIFSVLRAHETSSTENAHGDRIVISVNPDRFAQVIDNIVENAVSFSAEGPRSIELSADRKGAWAEIAIRDYGPGFPEGDAEKLFERFYSTRKTSEQGKHTGLGLAIVRSIVQSWGGKVEALAANPGARFVVSIPLYTGRETV